MHKTTKISHLGNFGDESLLCDQLPAACNKISIMFRTHAEWCIKHFDPREASYGVIHLYIMHAAR